MLKVIIIDDERHSIDILKILLENTKQVTVINTFQSPIQALNGINNIQPNVIFMDINMPEMNGIKLANNIRLINNNVEIVFVTTCDKYAFQAYSVDALDYLLKPISQDSIDKVIKRLIKIYSNYSIKQSNKSQARIQCFGEFEVYSDSSVEPLQWRTSKSKELMAYFFQNRGTPISKWKLCEVLWSGDDRDKVDVQLHTTIYKMKKTLKNAKIDIDVKYSNHAYIMTIKDVYSDVEEFKVLVNNKININDNNIKQYEKAISLYKNNYFEENDYIWSLDLKEVYLQKFIKISEELADFYIKNRDYDKAIILLRKALKISPLEECLHELLLQIYIIKQDRTTFIKHYKLLTNLFSEELGIELDINLKNMYKKAIK
jgi:two-component SAPR family response regulator